MPPDTCELLGQWRIEVSPGKPATDNVFLHLIQVGDISLQSMIDSEMVKTDTMTGVKFIYKDKEYEVMFFTKNKVGGKISINQNGRKIMEENFTDKVKSQKGLF